MDTHEEIEKLKATLAEVNGQLTYDIGLLAKVVTRLALDAGHSKPGIADLLDRAGNVGQPGGESGLYKTSSIKKLAAALRGVPFRRDFSVIDGGITSD